MPPHATKEQKIDVTVLVPAYNEELSIKETILRLQRVLNAIDAVSEIIIVNDGSTDDTSLIVKKISNVKLIEHAGNRGYGASLKTGLKAARGEWVLIVDADGTYPIEDFPRFWKERTGYDMVVGARDPKSQHISWTRKPGKMVLSFLANYLVGKKIPDLNSGMRLFKKELAMEFYHLYPQGFSFTITITLASLVNNYEVKYIPIHYSTRQGKSKMNVIRDGLNFIGLILRVITYFNPSKLLLPLGTFLILLGVIVAWYSLTFLGRFMDATVTLLILGGIQVFIFSILAQLIVKTRMMRRD